MVFKKILIAVDDSECSYKAAQTGFKLAQELGSNVKLICVVDEKYLIANPEFRTSYVDLYNLHLEQAENIVSKISKELGGTIKIELETPRNNPASAIIDIAKDWNADLVVMGTHGKSGIAKMFMGSTSQYVIRHLPIPCMIVRDDK
jgi:nucleotide-binding universal stress UspA family protein